MAYTYTRRRLWQQKAPEIIKDLAWLYSLDKPGSWRYVDVTNEYHYQRTYIFDSLEDYTALLLARG